MRTYLYIFSFLTFFIICCSQEDNITPPPAELPKDTLLFLGFDGMTKNDMEYEEPFIYVCAGREGVWRRNIKSMTEWEYLGLAIIDTGSYPGMGTMALDVLADEILVAYHSSSDTIRPDLEVSIWRSTNSGSV